MQIAFLVKIQLTLILKSQLSLQATRSTSNYLRSTTRETNLPIVCSKNIRSLNQNKIL
ncbi:MAG: hypothetical protein ACJA2C_000853 [Marinoscillum sp.]|jgi:hypothetical protein